MISLKAIGALCVLILCILTIASIVPICQYIYYNRKYSNFQPQIEFFFSNELFEYPLPNIRVSNTSRIITQEAFELRKQKEYYKDLP